MAPAIKPNAIYTVDFGNTTFQVRTIRRNPAVPQLWECKSLFSGRDLVLPEQSFVTQPPLGGQKLHKLITQSRSD